MLPKRLRVILLGLMLITTFLIVLPCYQNVNSTFLTHQEHGQLTGAAAVTDTTPFDVNGTDLGIILKHNGKYHYIFGDTFGCGLYMGNNWRSNTIAYSTDTDPSDGISLDGWIVEPGTGYAKELISSLKIDYVEMTCIPTAAVSYNGNIYIYYMSVRHWGIIGGVWQCNEASIAVSTDNGQTFTKMTNITWVGDGNFVQFGAAQSSAIVIYTYLYLLATPAGRFGACYLCRVPLTNILDQSAYEYFSGLDRSDNPIWSSNELSAVEVFEAPVGELSLMWNAYLEQWTVFYFNTADLAIVVRRAENIWGPWCPEQKITDATEYPSLYGSYVHPDLVENNGETVYFVMSIFSVYNTFIMSVDVSSLIGTCAIAIPKIFVIILVSFTALVIFQRIIKIVGKKRNKSLH